MVVLVLTACPAGLRGHVTRWLLEISPGVFVGKLSQRTRDRLWQQVVENSSGGRAIMVFNQRGEQGLGFKVHRCDWQPIDLDGVQLVLRPDAEAETTPSRRWSNAKRYRRSR